MNNQYRRYLNELLLNEAERHKNLRVVFNHKLIKCDTVTGELTFEKYLLYNTH
jgi:hypothetical protein